MSARDLYINIDADSPAAALVSNNNNRGRSSLPDLTLHDTRTLRLYFVDRNGVAQSLSGYTIKAAIGFPGAAPTGGTFRLKMGIGAATDRGAIAFDATASEIETAFGGSSVVAVTGNAPQWRLQWQSNGAVVSDNDASLLTPDSRVDVTTVTAGDSSTAAEQILTLSRAEVVTQNTWSAITDGFEGALSMNTDKLVRLVAGQAKVDATFEIELTDGDGDRTTVLQVPVTIRAEVIKDASVEPLGTEEYYTKAQADGLFLKISQNLADATAATCRTNLGISAANTPYTPADASDYSVTPDDVKDALDELADRTNGISATKTSSETSSVSAAGTETNIDPDDGKSHHIVFIDAAAGSAGYTKKYIVQRPTGGESAQLIPIKISLAASANPIVEIYDENATDSAGDDTLLFSAAGSAKRATEYFVLIAWNDTDSAWEVIHDSVGSAEGTQTVWVPALAMLAATTNGAAAVTAETSTNAVMTQGFAFDASTAESVQFTVSFPESWNEGTATARFHWFSSATGDCVWKISGQCLEDNGAIDTAFGSAISVTDSAVVANRNCITALTSAITLANAGSPSMAVFKAQRDAADSADTLSADAVLLGVEIQYVAEQGNDD